jgi:ferredoxin
VGKSIPAETNILTFEEVNHVIDNASSITLAPCLCRTNKRLIGEGCDAPVDDICILFDSWAEYYARKGLGRAVDKAEAKKALERAEKAGLVHSTLNVKEGGLFICNCCGCCCALLRGITQLKIPTSTAKSNFRARVSEQGCVGCNGCVDACHVKAIELKDSVAIISEESCIGCGLCVSACPLGAVTMERKEQIDATPETLNDLMVAIAAGRVD